MFESLRRLFTRSEPNREPSLEEAQSTLIRSLGPVLNREASFGNERIAELAKEIVSSELGIHPEVLQFRAEITRDVAAGSPDIRNKMGRGHAPTEEQVIPVELRDAFSLELKKRVIINQLIHGGAHQIERCSYTSWSGMIDRDIGQGTADLYRDLMHSARQIYAFLPDTLDSRTLASPAGLSWVEVPEEGNAPIIVNAKALCLPVLAQECAKGALEAIALWGLPGATDGAQTNAEDKEMHTRLRRLVLQSDSIATDIRDVKAGDIVWKALVRDVVKEGDSVPRYLKALFSLPATDFNHRVERALAGDNESLKGLLRST